MIAVAIVAVVWPSVAFAVAVLIGKSIRLADRREVRR